MLRPRKLTLNRIISRSMKMSTPSQVYCSSAPTSVSHLVKYCSFTPTSVLTSTIYTNYFLANLKNTYNFASKKTPLQQKKQLKRTQAPKHHPRSKYQKIDPYTSDYSQVPQDIRKEVKAQTQIQNLLSPSQGEVQAHALHKIILEERKILETTVSHIGMLKHSTYKMLNEQVDLSSTEKIKEEIKKIQKVQSQKYDIATVLAYMTGLSRILVAVGISGSSLLYFSGKYQMLGFFTGIYLNPTVSTLAGLTIGFNCAAWILRQSLHLEYPSAKELTVEKISLKSCGYMMQLNALSIALQAFSLGYYLTSAIPFKQIEWLIFAVLLSQSQLIINTQKITNGIKFQYLLPCVWQLLINATVLAGFVYWIGSLILQGYQILDLENGVKQKAKEEKDVGQGDKRENENKKGIQKQLLKVYFLIRQKILEWINLSKEKEQKRIKQEQSQKIKSLQSSSSFGMSEAKRQEYLKAVRVRMGYQNFLSIFRTKKIEIVQGQKINQLLLSDE